MVARGDGCVPNLVRMRGRVWSGWSIAVATFATVAIATLTASCSGDDGDGSAAVPPVLRTLLDTAATAQWRATGADVIEVWTCRVPTDTTAAIYGGLPLRYPLQPAALVETFTTHVTPYFDALSHGNYHPVFVAGGEVMMSASEEPQQCLDTALTASSPTARAVLAIADAEHAPGEPGGFGTPGGPCEATNCAASITRRSAYVAGNDFNPDLAASPPMDLVEHELGHLLGWTHSGLGPDGEYLSGLDVMSNSAAPRDVDPTRTDGPDTLGIDRLLAGWLTVDALWVAPSKGGSVHLAPSTADPAVAAGAAAEFRRLAIVPIDDSTFLTVELLVPVGVDAHLPAAGIAVHRVVVRDGAIESIVPLVGDAPFTTLLGASGSLAVDGWRITAEPPSTESAAPDGVQWKVSIVPNLGA